MKYDEPKTSGKTADCQADPVGPVLRLEYLALQLDDGANIFHRRIRISVARSLHCPGRTARPGPVSAGTGRPQTTPVTGASPGGGAAPWRRDARSAADADRSTPTRTRHVPVVEAFRSSAI